jgi:hypothetical protein
VTGDSPVIPLAIKAPLTQKAATPNQNPSEEPLSNAGPADGHSRDETRGPQGRTMIGGWGLRVAGAEVRLADGMTDVHSPLPGHRKSGCLKSAFSTTAHVYGRLQK